MHAVDMSLDLLVDHMTGGVLAPEGRGVQQCCHYHIRREGLESSVARWCWYKLEAS